MTITIIVGVIIQFILLIWFIATMSKIKDSLVTIKEILIHFGKSKGINIVEK
jgi:hypothetical protein